MHFIKKLIPNWLLRIIRPIYHGLIARAGSVYFGHPSDRLIVIGVTGTNGKTTAVNLIARILEEAGLKTGFTSTAVLNIEGKEILNQTKITMPSGWLLQKWMKQMLQRGCQCAVLEVSSEGLAQNRHLGINFDAAVFTNLTPEHLEAHGGMENYQAAKARLFESLNKLQITNSKRKIRPNIKKTIIINADDENGKYYGGFKADKYVTYGIKSQQADIIASDITYAPSGISFMIDNLRFALHLKGQFDVYNSLAAVAAAQALAIDLATCQKALEKVSVVPGRVEVVQEQPFTVVVDYAYEPEEMRQLYETVKRWPHKRIIQVLGPTGGGRDRARIPILGEMAAAFADIIIITIDDPYDDNPKTLADLMARGATTAGKILNTNCFIILDRRQAFAKALKFIQPGDLLLITGKGADQKMALARGKYIEWDDRKVIKEELGHKMLNENKNFARGLV